MRSCHDNAVDRVNNAVFGIILVSAFFSSIYSADHRSLDWDQLLVLVISRTPWEYIWRWCSSVEMHPPYYHYLIKTASRFSESLVFYQLISAAAFLGVLASIRSLCRTFATENAALLACAVYAACPLAIYSGFALRPHSLSVLCVTRGLLSLLRWFDTRRRADLLTFTAWNTLGVMFHYMSAVFVAGYGLIVLMELARTRTITLRTLTAFAVSFLISAVPIVFVFGGALHSPGLLFSSISIGSVLSMIGEAYRLIALLLFPYSQLIPDAFQPLALALMVVATALPFTRWRIGSPLLRYVPATILLPAPILLAMKHGYVVFRYLQPLMPLFSILLGCLLARLAPRRLALVMALALVLPTAFETALHPPRGGAAALCRL